MTSSSSELPRRVAGYQVLRVLGRGGMGAVYAVHDPATSRELALKQLLGSDPEALVRFQREAELLARVRHTNVLAVHSAGVTPQGPFLLTELVSGESLSARLTRGPLRPREAAAIVRDLAGGLERCHALGLIHRDLKPQNVMLRADGSPVLIDFGVARDLAGQRLTRSGEALGTPAYMAPEQASGGEVDARTDVYGLGAILYEALTGRPPFSGPHAMAVMTQVATAEPPRPSALGVPVPAELEAILEAAMAKEPGRRLASAAALCAALDGWLRPAAAPAEVSTPRAPAALWAGAATALLAAVVAVGVAAQTRSPRGPPVGGEATTEAVVSRARPTDAPTATTAQAETSPVVSWGARVRAAEPANRPGLLGEEGQRKKGRAEELSRSVSWVLGPRSTSAPRGGEDLSLAERRLRHESRRELESLAEEGFAVAEVALGRLRLWREAAYGEAAELFWSGSRLPDPDDFALVELSWLLMGRGEVSGAEWSLAEGARRLAHRPNGDVAAQLALTSVARGADADLGRALRILHRDVRAERLADGRTGFEYLAGSDDPIAAALLEVGGAAGWTTVRHPGGRGGVGHEVEAERLRARWRLLGPGLLTCASEADGWCEAHLELGFDDVLRRP